MGVHKGARVRIRARDLLHQQQYSGGEQREERGAHRAGKSQDGEGKKQGDAASNREGGKGRGGMRRGKGKRKMRLRLYPSSWYCVIGVVVAFRSVVVAVLVVRSCCVCSCSCSPQCTLGCSLCCCCCRLLLSHCRGEEPSNRFPLTPRVG